MLSSTLGSLLYVIPSKILKSCFDTFKTPRKTLKIGQNRLKMEKNIKLKTFEKIEKIFTEFTENIH